MTVSKPDYFFMPAARWTTIALGVAIPLSTALDNILLFILLAVLVGNSRAVWQELIQNAVARACLMLFTALMLGMAYGATPLKDAAGILGKYSDLPRVTSKPAAVPCWDFWRRCC